MARYVIENPGQPDQIDVWCDQPQFIKNEQGKNTNVIKTDDEGRQIYRRCVCRSIDKDSADALNQKIGDTTRLVQEFDSLKTVVQDRHTSTQSTINDFSNALENEVTVRAQNDLVLQTNIDTTNGSIAEFKNNYKVNVGVGLPVTDKQYATSILGRVSKIEDKLSTDSKGTFATKTFVVEKTNAILNNANTALDLSNRALDASNNTSTQVESLSSSMSVLNASVQRFEPRLKALESNSDIGTVTAKLGELESKDTSQDTSIQANANEIEQLKARCEALEKFISRITNQSISFDNESYDVVVLAPEEPEE